jgi:DNA invertase Pin-like site-specific DNA recombinase
VDDEELRRQLAEVGARRAAARELAPLIRQAVDQGIPLAEVARIASLSRQGAYELLRRPLAP